jgi:hypothetical protein
MKPPEVIERLRQRGIMGSVTPYANHLARLAPSLLTSSGDVEKTIEAIHDLGRL